MVSNLSHIAYSYVDELQYIELCKFLYKEQRRKHMTQHILYDNHGREPVSELHTRKEYRAFTDYVNANYDDFYGCKIGYEVNVIGENFEVKLTSNDFVNLKDILLDIRK